ncbi:rho GTPase-activating protein 27 [Fukomys damarensis]|uniref:rho GTPase-activating protein 27 n=1 Tax=Fukomys damarensis TaxID=885580 RepID=UPI00053FC8FC|nr:rho GTPase-activating protein 27 [Fukomys damarensis]
MAADVEGQVDVLVEHPFEYTGRDGRHVVIRPNERYRLLRRSTPHWWHVRPWRRGGGDPRDFHRTDAGAQPQAYRPRRPADCCRVPDSPGLSVLMVHKRRTVQAGSGSTGPSHAPSRGQSENSTRRARKGPAHLLIVECVHCLTRNTPGVGMRLCTLNLRVCVKEERAGAPRALALCQPWGCAPWLHPQRFPRAWSQQLRGDRMVDVIAKLTRKQSRALRVQLCHFGVLSDSLQTASVPTVIRAEGSGLRGADTGEDQPELSPEGGRGARQVRRAERALGQAHALPQVHSEGWKVQAGRIRKGSDTRAPWAELSGPWAERALTLEGEADRWELPQVPVPAPRSIHKTSQDGGTPAPASPPQEKIKTLDKAGVLHCTRTADKGKRLRKKHWSTSWTVLEGGVLTFFKDCKTSAAGSLRQQPSKLSTPEYTVELKAASLSWAPKDKSSKKNVLELRSRDGSEYLIQHDSEGVISAWHKAIAQGIEDQVRRAPDSWGPALHGTPEGGLSRGLCRCGHLPLQGRQEEKLRERGYIKDQVFGCALATLCAREKSSVPCFVQQCVRAVEARGLDTDGLYRISGNLATIQRLRYHVDHEERLDLDDGRWSDVHVITGALKLFLRELPEPLFPFSHFSQFLAAIKLQDPARRSRCVRDLVRSLPTPNHDTLQLLFQHLRRVVEHGEQNRMSVQNVAIVFGPTLLRPETEEASVPMTMVFQNQVVELILQQCTDIFPPH